MPPIESLKTEFEFVKNLEGKPDKMLRILPLDAGNPEELQESLKVLNRGEALFHRLRDRYGISIPDMQTTINKKNDGTVEAKIEVDKIYGIEPSETPKLQMEAGESLDKFYFALANHYWDVFRNGGDYWFDFRDDQLIYGHKLNSNEDSVYVVDVDPEYQSYDPKQKTQGKRLLRLMGRIYDSVITMENKLPHKAKFENTRKFLGEIFAKIPENEPFYKEFILKAKNDLERDKTHKAAA